jgi:hypothetical protein
VFGPGRHPTSGARFLYFKGPDGMIFEHSVDSVGVEEIKDEATHRPRQFGFEPLLHVGLQARRHGPAEQLNAPTLRDGRMNSARPCAFLCPAQVGYMTGQNILIDGGAYPGTF